MAKDIKTDIEFVREIVRGVLSDISYHEKKIVIAHMAWGFAKEMMRRGSFDLEAARADYDDETDELATCDVTQFALHFYDENHRSVEYHEQSLKMAYRNLGFAKTLLARGNYTEIDIDQMQKEIEAKADK